MPKPRRQRASGQTRKAQRVRAFLQAFAEWARAQPDVMAAALVGSYANNAARTDSDVDLVLIARQPQQYVSNSGWAATFGEMRRQQIEDYGKLTSLRVWYRNGLEVEYGITGEEWIAEPLDAGTRRVIEDGMVVLFERGEILGPHQRADRLR